MKRRIIGIFVMMLLIATAVLPVVGISKLIDRDGKTPSLDSLNGEWLEKRDGIKIPHNIDSYQDMELTSPAFENDGVIPVKYTCDAEDQIGVSPPLTINNIPENALSLAIIVDDPDANDWVHWVVYDIPSPQPATPTLSLLEDAGAEGGDNLPEGAEHGLNSWPTVNDFYRGPCPPSGTHHYNFAVYALDTMLDLPPSLSRTDLDNEMNGHIIETAELTGIYGHDINQPPSVEITSPSDGETISGTIAIQGTAADIDGTVNQVQIKIDSDSWQTTSDTTSWSYSLDTTTINYGEHTIYARSKDNDDSYSIVDSVTVTVDNNGNQPPNKPTCRYDENNDELVVSATDSDGDKVKYGISWNNNQNVDQWTGLVNSGTQQKIDCGGRTGTVGVITEDEYGAQSDWVSQKSKNKAINTPFLQFLENLLQNHPHLFPLLQKLLELK